MPLKYIGHNDTVVTWTGIPHGWLYMILIITAFDLGRRARWAWGRLILIALAGTVPFLSFVAEHYATKDVRAKLSVYPRVRRPVGAAGRGGGGQRRERHHHRPNRRGGGAGRAELPGAGYISSVRRLTRGWIR